MLVTSHVRLAHGTLKGAEKRENLISIFNTVINFKIHSQKNSDDLENLHWNSKICHFYSVARPTEAQILVLKHCKPTLLSYLHFKKNSFSDHLSILMKNMTTESWINKTAFNIVSNKWGIPIIYFLEMLKVYWKIF